MISDLLIYLKSYKLTSNLCSNLFFLFAPFNRLYGNTGLCSACNKLIPAFEMVMRAKRNVYHLECFACQQCSHRYNDLLLILCVISDMHQTAHVCEL